MDEHEALLSEWEKREHHRGNGFIKDGIIDPSRWSQCSRKVLLLLKEAYGEYRETKDWDLRERIREEEGYGGTWLASAYYCYVAQKTGLRVPKWPSETDAKTALLCAALINIKKSGGESVSDAEDIAEFVRKDGELIRRQIYFINPDIIICGNTWDVVKSLWKHPVEMYDMVFKAEEFTFINFWHPANRFPPGLDYYALGCLVQNAELPGG